MNKTLTLAAALAALSLAVPAAAQSGYGGYEARAAQLQNQVQRGVQRGTITRQEAISLRDQLRQLTRQTRQFGRDGLSRNERRVLDQHIDYLQQQIRLAERNRNDRGRDWDRDDRGRDWDRDDRRDWDRDERRDWDRRDDRDWRDRN